jgi:hypothetical protein
LSGKRRRAVRAVDVEAHATDGCGCAKADGEGEVAGAAVAFHLADIVDADGWAEALRSYWWLMKSYVASALQL